MRIKKTYGSTYWTTELEFAHFQRGKSFLNWIWYLRGSWLKFLSICLKLEVMRKVSKISLLTDLRPQTRCSKCPQRKDTALRVRFFLHWPAPSFLKTFPFECSRARILGSRLTFMCVCVCVCVCMWHAGMRQDVLYHIGQNTYLLLKLLNISECFPPKKKTIIIICFHLWILWFAEMKTA